MTEVEPFPGPRDLGALEAFVTSGGTSTAPETYRGRLESYDYKTVRYPGHHAQIRAMIDLGLLDRKPVQVGATRVVPRELFHAVAGPRLRDPDVRDVVLLQVDCTDARGKGVRYRMLQPFDEETGFTAMEQTTGYPTALVALVLARGALAPGATTPERAGFGPEHLTALRARGLKIRRLKLA
jgi:lysine 6-dehydrogenase